MTLRLATLNGIPVPTEREQAPPANPRNSAPIRLQSFRCMVGRDGALFAEYQRAKAAWDKARNSDDPNRPAIREAARAAYDAWALSRGLAPISAPKSWGFN